MNNKKMTFAAPFIAALAASLWGTLGIFTRYLYSLGFSSYQASFLRCFITALIIVPIMLVKFRPRMRLKKKSDLLCFFLAGTLGLALSYTTYFMTMKTSTLAMAAVMVFTGPVFITFIASFLFHEKITKKKLLSVILAVAGVVTMSGIIGDATVSLSGIGLVIGILSGVGYALYNIGSRLCLERGYDSFAVTAYTFIFATLGVLPFTPLKKTAVMLYQHPTAILAALALGVVCTLIGYSLYVIALKYIEVSRAAVITFIEPVAATTIGMLLFDEAIALNGIIAIILIFASILVVNVERKPKSNNIEN